MCLLGTVSDSTDINTGRTSLAPDAPQSLGSSVLDSRPKLRENFHSDADHGLVDRAADRAKKRGRKTIESYMFITIKAF